MSITFLRYNLLIITRPRIVAPFCCIIICTEQAHYVEGLRIETLNPFPKTLDTGCWTWRTLTSGYPPRRG